MPQCVTLSLYRFDGIRDRIWAFSQMGLARLGLARTPGLGFWKLFGSGVGEGFTPLPNTAVWAILGVWDSAEDAARQTTGAPVFARFGGRSAESWTIHLAATSARGLWSGTAPFHAEPGAHPGPVAALTRATIRPRKLLRFWGRAPAISRTIGADPEVLFKVGLGEVPLLHQVTFSIWPDTGAMARFARRGPHAEAIRGVREGGWFSEELYARFRILGDTGTWEARRPLDPRGTA